MKVAFVQFAPAYLESDANLNAAEALVDGVDADLVVLPELAASGYFFRSSADAQRAAEPVPNGPTTERLHAWARASGATYVAGLAEQTDDALYNSAVVVGPEGHRGTYRKVHLYYEENEHFAPGNLGFPVFDVQTRDGTAYRLGVMVCFDWYFPEAARSLALRGADVIAHPSNLVLPHCPDSMPVRARENHVFTITANRYGTESNGEESLTFIGMSEICDPTGDIRLRANRDTDQVGIVDIDPTRSRNKGLNRYNDALGDRREAVYARVADPEGGNE